MITFVIPTYNRGRNLSLVLHGLELQTDRDFSVVVSDDGSIDQTFDVVRSFADSLNPIYCWQPHDGYRVSLVRNQGTRLVPQDTTHLWYIDSDVVLHREAVANVRPLIERHPEKVIAGRYDWMPPMIVTPHNIEHTWQTFVECSLPWMPGVPPDAEYGGRFSPGVPFHKDPRLAADWSSVEVSPCGGGMLSGNLVVPYSAWIATGGFDENIEAQGQDSEFGRHCGQRGYEMVYSDAIRGYHLYHYRDIMAMTLGVRDTIRYIHEKYNLPLREENLPPLPPE